MVIIDPHSQSNNDDNTINMMNNDDNNEVPSSCSMAAAFQGACDADAQMTLQALANPTVPHDSLKFYLIPYSWMDSCRSYLQDHSQERPNIEIPNATLLATKHPISSSSDEESEESRKRRLRQRKWRERQRLNRSLNKILKSDLVLNVDYYLVGPSVWLLLGNKFGYDVELERNVVQHNNTLAVNMGSWVVGIPPSGRFECGIYEQTDVVSEEEEVNDLFPSMDNDNSHNTSQPLLLLPPSTTTTTTTTDNLYDSPSTNTNNNKLLYLQEEEKRPLQQQKLRASGLGNLGNTCFMNSTLQCLAHTDSLRRYFLSGEYLSDLNRDNPLGAGGELATEFAELLKEMWGYKQTSATYYSTYSSPVVYPRNFKGTLGRHAAQFLGYDQHDSHELATYLLDALHEDTNRISKKPYIEKPEQGEDEPDDVAAAKAWEVHLKREDSRVMENFIGQVKSRVQCPVEGCGRVSTTFDPFMYLSVPIPGASDRTLTVTFVPLEPQERCKTLSVTLSKTSSMAALQKKIVEILGSETLKPQDVCLADVWTNEIYTFYNPKDEIDKIRDTDTTVAYQMRPVSSIHEEPAVEEEESTSWDDSHKRFECHASKLPMETLNKFQNDNDWMQILEHYVTQPTMLYALFSPTRGKMEERLTYYRKLTGFVELLHSCSDAKLDGDSSQDESSPTMEERSETSPVFRNVRTAEDLGILECCIDKFREYIIDLKKKQRDKYKDGATVQVVFQRKPRLTHYHSSADDRTFTAPLALRIPPSMTVYGLREEIGKRISRSLKTGRPSAQPIGATMEMAPEDTESSVVPVDMEPENDAPMPGGQPNGNDVMAENMDLGSPEMLIMRQIPMTYKKSEHNMYKASSTSFGTNPKLGMLERAGNNEAYDGRPISLASSSDEAEKKIVCNKVGDGAIVYLHWPTELAEQYLDVDEYEACDEWKPQEADSAGVLTRKAAKKTTTVSDCIERYCQMEQLEESEMWFCNRCKEHVRAWKQFHLYRTPPILIIHLKRFHYSATTHRRDKIDSFIDFPLTGLDLTNEVMQWTEEEKPIYDLYAVSNHFGGLGGGHYTAYALSDDGKWCNFDDSRVTTDVDPKEVKSSAAYVLYYRRRDVALDGMDIPRPAIVQDNVEDTVTSDELTSATPSQFRMEIDSDEMVQSREDDYELDAEAASNASVQTCDSLNWSVEEQNQEYVYDDGGDGFGGTPAADDFDDYPLQ